MTNYDHVIIGGGSAGATLAARLSEDPDRSVLLIEAGATPEPDAPEDRLANVSFALTARDWGMRADVGGGRSLDYPQGRFLGGGSSVNGGLAFRGTPQDYDDWAGAGNPSWSWDRMLPMFRRLERDVDFGEAEAVHGGAGPIPVVRWGEDDLVPIQEAFRAGCESLGHEWNPDHNQPESMGVGPLPMNRIGDVRVSTALAYLAPVADRPNLDVWDESVVERVRIVEGRVQAVEVRRHGGSTVVAAEDVTLAAGSIHSPAILWRSGIGPADALTDLGITCVVDNAAVGANLVDHPGVFVFARPVGTGIGPTDPQYQLGVRYSSTGGTPADMFMSMMNVWDLTASPDFRAVVGVDTAVVLTCGVHDPMSRGRVSLSSADASAAPVIELNLLDHPLDVARLLEGLRLCRALAATPSMSTFLDGVSIPDDATFDDDAALGAYARQVVAGWYHPIGTCRMGPSSAPDTVVGDDLAVHGVIGLRVVDASIMPRPVKAPTNLTAIAIAERAADLIRGL